jgi:hypothetical protein
MLASQQYPALIANIAEETLSTLAAGRQTGLLE